ncbi:MAG: GH36 C-terminal domain-containing protein [Marinilabiliaceae bacterium]|nr:GH36 C-terminal domain-containing protein [Marinilabiliaceae bacterium]
MQWNYSYLFPAIATDCHVTDWGKQPIKYRIDVASMGKLGFDIVAKHLTANDLLFCQQAVKNYNSFKDIVWHGQQYRLANPYDNLVASIMYVNDQRDRAIIFTYLHNFRYNHTGTPRPIRLNGLDPDKNYRIKELNLYPGTKTTLNQQNLYSGAFLMNVGLNPDVQLKRASVIIEIEEYNGE